MLPIAAAETKNHLDPRERLLLTEAQGVPLAATVTGANAADVTQLLPLVDSIPDLAGDDGDNPTGPEELDADRADDSEPHREELRDREIESKIPQRRTEQGSGLGIDRWVVERTESWLQSCRKLRLRTDAVGAIHRAFVSLACALIWMWFL